MRGGYSMFNEVMRGWNDIDLLDSYVVYQSHFWRGAWSGKLVDKEGKTIYIVGMEQDDIVVSLDKEHVENRTKLVFDTYMRIKKGEDMNV
jgi:hypothetical protein